VEELNLIIEDKSLLRCYFMTTRKFMFRAKQEK